MRGQRRGYKSGKSCAQEGGKGKFYHERGEGRERMGGREADCEGYNTNERKAGSEMNGRWKEFVF